MSTRSHNPASQPSRSPAAPKNPALRVPERVGFQFAAPITVDGVASPLAQLESRLERVSADAKRLSNELARCHEQLSAIYEITENLAVDCDHRTVESSLLSRLAKVLDARAVYVVRDAAAQRVVLAEAAGGDAIDVSSELPQRLQELVRRVRESRRAVVDALPQASRMAAQRGHLLASLMPRVGDGDAVILATRSGDQPDFDSGDQLAADTVLAYGGHIISNSQMVERIRRSTFETVAALAKAIDARDAYTSGHSSRVAWLARLVGRALQLPRERLQILEWAGLLHDVGKLGVPEHILNKPGKLTAEEFEIVKRHPRIGHDMLSPVSSLQPVLAGVLHHHENHDGSGYPCGLRGDEISDEAKILHIVDVFDALTSNRSYRGAFDVPRALDVIREGIGKSTEPRMTDVFLKALDRYMSGKPTQFARRFGIGQAAAGVESRSSTEQA